MPAQPSDQQLTPLEPRTVPLNRLAHQTSPGEGIVIDHRFFPHIIDLIWSFMPYPSLVVATMVCKSWRKDSIKLLFEHVAVMECNRHGCDIIIRSRNTSWPERTALLIKAAREDVHEFEDIFNLTKVIDLLPNPNMPLDRGAKVCYLFDMLDGGGVNVRLHIPPAIDMHRAHHVAAPVVVCFLDYSAAFYLTRASPVCSEADLTLSLNCYSDPTAPLVPAPSNQIPWYLDLCTGTERLEHFTIILINMTGQDPPRPIITPLASHTPTPAEIPSAFLDREPPTLGIVYEVLRLAMVVYRVKAIAIVGAEAYLSERDGRLYRAELRQTMNSEAGAFRDADFEDSDDEDVKMGDKIKFFTHEEYRKLVGEDRYRLETVR